MIDALLTRGAGQVYIAAVALRRRQPSPAWQQALIDDDTA